MIIPKRLLTQSALIAGWLILLVTAMPALSQSGPPPLPILFLDYYSFPQTNLLSDYGYAPIGESNAFIIPFWDAYALWLDTSNETPAYVHYNVVETNGYANIDLAAGTIFIQVVPDWASADTNQFGHGPGARGYVLASGDFSSGSPEGLWSIYVDAGGTNIYFGGVSNSVTNIYVSARISWATNSLHEIGVYYGTNSELFLDGQWVATGGPVTIVPATNTWTNGFYVGSDGSGYEQFRGIFPYIELDTTNIYLYDTNYLTLWWTWDTNSYYAWLDPLGGGGGFHPDGGGFHLPPPPTNSVNTNYAQYTNFWLSITNGSTNVYVNVENTLSNITYLVFTNASLANSNGWKIWEVLLASNSITPAPPLAAVSNTLYFNAEMVWSTCTDYSPALPDWWAMLYFNSTACVNPAANPSGDGIDNWDKYLLGLNPNVAYVNQLIVNPPGGNYVAIPSISVFSLSGASIKYTTNGSTPSATNGFTASSGVPLTNLPSGSFTLKAWESGLVSNVPAIATYTIIPATPVFSVPSGIYGYGSALQISSVTTNAVVRYTTNGSSPTTNSTQIQPTNVITLLSNEIIEAAAWLGTNVSPVAEAAYIVEGPPPNDDYSNATVLSGASGTIGGSLVGSTTEAFEQYNPIAYFFWADFAGNSVWYKWTAPSNGNVFFEDIRGF